MSWPIIQAYASMLESTYVAITLEIMQAEYTNAYLPRLKYMS